MTVVVESPQLLLKGNGTKTGYSFTFSLTKKGDLNIYYTPSGGLEKKLGKNDFSVTLNQNRPGGTIEFLTITPQPTDILRFIRESEIDQKIDFIGIGVVSPENVEHDFDKNVRILQEVKFLAEGHPHNKIPDPDLQQVGKFIVTDGKNGYFFYPLKIDLPAPGNDNNVLVVDLTNKRLKFIAQPGFSNPAIPQPPQEYKYIVSDAGVYTLTPEHTKPMQQNDGQTEVWDESQQKFRFASFSHLPRVSALQQALVSTQTAGGDYGVEWRDYRPVISDLSSGIVSGCVVTRESDTEISVGAGVLQIVSAGAAPPASAELLQFSATGNISIDTSVEKSHFVYIETSPSTSVVVETAYTPQARGSKIFLCEVEHTHDQIITSIETSAILVTAVPSQIREFVKALVGNAGRNIVVSPVSTDAGADPANRQIRYTGGLFVGYGANANSNKLLPHELGIAEKSLAAFRWRDSADADSAEISAFPNQLQYESAPGVLTNVPANNFVLAPIWLYPNGDIKVQYPRAVYQTKASIPALSDFLATFKKSPIASRNAALLAIAQLRQGFNFSNKDDVFIANIGGISAGGNTGSGLPPVTPQDEGKLLIANNNSAWVISPFSIPAPQAADVGKTLKVKSTAELEYGQPEDLTARTWLANGIFDGFKTSYIGGSTSLTISAGKALLCMDGTVGSPANIRIVNYPGGTYHLQNPTSQNSTFIEMDENGVLSETAALTSYIRGSKITLFRVDHATDVIESVYPVYRDLNCIPEQIKEVFEAYGNVINGITIMAAGTNTLSHTGGVFHGFNVNAQIDLLSPHKKILSPLSPIDFRFRDRLGENHAGGSNFPAIPKIELSAGVLTSIPINHVAYFPLWIRSDGECFFQYAETSYLSTGNVPSASDYITTFRRDKDLQAVASLQGVVKWERGKNFSTGNSFISINNVSGGSSSGGLLPAGPSDSTKIYTIDNSGKTVLGPRLAQPFASSEEPTFANKILQYNPQGSAIIASDVRIPSLGDLAAGDHFVVSRDGILETLNNKTEFVDPSVWATIDQQYYNVEPFGIRLSAKGIMVSRGRKNNVQDPSVRQKLRLGDIFDSFEKIPWNYNNTVMTDPSTGRFSNVYNDNRGGTVNYYDSNSRFKFAPDNQTFAGYFTPAAGVFRTTTSSNVAGVGEGFFWYEENTSPHCFGVLASPVEEGYSLSNSGTDPIRLRIHGNGTNVAMISIVEFEANVVNTRESSKWAAAFKPKDIGEEIVFTLTLKQFSIENKHDPASSPIKSTYNISLWTTSDTEITADTTKVFDIPNTQPVGRTYTLPLNITTKFSSLSGDYYHKNNSDPESGKSNVMQFGILIEPPQAQTGIVRDSLQNGALDVELTAEKVTFLENRYEYGTLASISTLPENKDPSTPVATHVFTGSQPTLKAGKILIFYYLMYPKIPQSLSDFDPDMQGIVLHQFDPLDYPSIFLENQTGTSVPTTRIEANRRKGRSSLFEIYELGCTQNQFDNWKLAVYFRNLQQEAAFKIKANSVGASIWLVNEEDI